MIEQSEILSKSAYAARRGVSATAVSNWFNRGKLNGECLTPDGRIIVAKAEYQLGGSLDHSRSEGKRAAPLPSLAQMAAPAAGPTVRELILEVELERKRRQLREEAGVYIRADKVEAEMGRALSQLIAATENWIVDLIGELGGGAEELAVARRSFRRFRERQADMADGVASQLPRLVTDAT